jgi:hypothetical protein
MDIVRGLGGRVDLNTFFQMEHETFAFFGRRMLRRALVTLCLISLLSSSVCTCLSAQVITINATSKAADQVLTPIVAMLRNFRPLFHVAGDAQALPVAQAELSASSDAGSTHLVFAPNSFWYTRLPIDAPTHPNSRAFVQDFFRQSKTFYNTVTINTRSYSSPIYVVGNDVVTVPVGQWDCHKPSYRDKQLDEMWQKVPIPADAQPADGTDSEMTVYQPSKDALWEFWLARNLNGRWQACWGGRMLNVSKSDGIWPPHYGASATGLPFIGGQITADELRRGEINHVLGISLVETESANIFSWPANRSDGENPALVSGRIPEGLRFRLDPTIDLEALHLHPVAKIIAQAAQTYGFVVWDRAGAISLRATNPKSFTSLGLSDPYPGLFNGTPPYNILAGIPWDKLQFLPMNYGKP